MLSSKEWGEFWEWYHQGPVSKTMMEEVADEIYFIKHTSNEYKYEKQIEFLLSKGSEMEILTENDKYSAILDHHYTDWYNSKEDLYIYAITFLVYLYYKRKIIIEEKIMINETVILHTVDSKGKLRISINSLQGDGHVFKIQRSTGLADGKLTVQPEKTIDKGKVKRTVTEQAQLEFNSMIQKQKDKGYKSLEDLNLPASSSLSTVLEVLGTKKTSADGYNKPFLAKDLNASKNKEKLVDDGSWFASYKLDGIRVLIHLEDDKLIFKTRGGKVFSGVTERFKDDPFLKNWIKQYNCEIDGEFYTHGVNLETLSGACRLDNYDPLRHEGIRLYIFDIADDHSTTAERVDTLNDMQKEDFDRTKIAILKHHFIESWDELTDLHNKALSEGYEGTIIRKSDALYQFGKRNNNMWKRKDFQDEEFEVIGYQEGLRPTEDMVFKLRTKEGKEFEAKPVGDRELKARYVDNMNDLIGKYGTVKFFYYTADGIPFLPVFKCFRDVVENKVSM